MGVSLIEQYCSAIEQWAETTRQETYDLIVWSMMHSGGFWRVRAEGQVDDPYAPEHRNKKVGEVLGRYTLQQLRAYLEHLADDVHIMEDTLISGLIRSIETELTDLVVGYKAGLDRTRRTAERFQRYYEHPDEYAELIELINSAFQERGLEPLSGEGFLSMAYFMWRMSLRSEDEEAQRQSGLAAWKRVTAGIVEQDNLSRWRSEHLASLTGLRP